MLRQAERVRPAMLAEEIRTTLAGRLMATRQRVRPGHQLDLVIADLERALGAGDDLVRVVCAGCAAQAVLRALEAIPAWLRYGAWYELARAARASAGVDADPAEIPTIPPPPA